MQLSKSDMKSIANGVIWTCTGFRVILPSCINTKKVGTCTLFFEIKSVALTLIVHHS